MAFSALRRAQRLTVLSGKGLYGVHSRYFNSSTHSASTDSDLIDCFDGSKPNLPRFQQVTGLFGDSRLSHPQAFHGIANEALNKAQLLVTRIENALASREELFKVVRNLDKLSDVLCSVIDLAEFVRNAHPDPEWVEQADTVYETLCEYMNVLNTHAGLDKVSVLHFRF